MSFTRRLPVAFLLALCACVAPPMRRPATPAPEAPATAVSRNVTGPWPVGIASRSQRVEVTTVAIVVFSGDSVSRTDTLNATLAASYTKAGGVLGKVDGLLTDYRIAFGGDVPAVPAGLQLARPFSAVPSPGNRELSFRLPAETSACADPAFSALQFLHDAWIPVPDTLRIGREWSDTVHTFSCRDRIPLRGVSVRKFRVVRGEGAEGGRIIVTIERSARGTVAGDGEQFGEHVVLEGSSHGTLHYRVDPATGQLLHATGNNFLTLSLKSRRRNQTARQESRVTITWVP